MADSRSQTGIVLSSNGFEIELPDEVDVLVREFPDPMDVTVNHVLELGVDCPPGLYPLPGETR